MRCIRSSRWITAAVAVASLVMGATLACADTQISPPPPNGAPVSTTPATPGASDPVTQRAQAIKEAGNQLDKAGQALHNGNKNFAEQLFSMAEVVVGAESLADLAPLFREGAPPRTLTPLKQLPKDAAAQPAVGTSSDEEDPPEEKPKRGVVAGTLEFAGKPLTGRGVITLEPAGGHSKSRPPKDRVMEQRNRDFAPKILVVRKGSSVSFPNFDTIYHNVFSRSEAKSFDLGIYKNGQARELVFDKPGIVRLGCNLHANMSAYIVVVDAPHYAISDPQGSFKFKSLTPGKYKMRVYTERSAEPVVQEVTVKPDATTTVMVATSADVTPQSVDKFGKARGK